MREEIEIEMRNEDGESYTGTVTWLKQNTECTEIAWDSLILKTLTGSDSPTKESELLPIN